MEEEKTALFDLDDTELREFVKTKLSENAYRAKQIALWLSRGASIDEMTDLPKSMRQKLSDIAITGGAEIFQRYDSKIDDTTKFLFRLRDGELVEGVRMGYKHGHTLCLSTQVGCRMGCKFCASTLDGLKRNLTDGEMLGQIAAVNRLEGGGRQIDNLVLMGSGEPFDNYNFVVRMLKRLNSESGPGIGLRNVSLSTCGLVPKMLEFADEGLPVTLCLSLHAPNDELRKTIMPIANTYRIKDIMEALRNYVDKTGRRAIVEYSLISKVNDSEREARELAGLLRGMRVHVNVIALNPVKERGLSAPSDRSCEAFIAELERLHISVTRRRTMGADIEGACGQLRRRVLSEGDM